MLIKKLVSDELYGVVSEQHLGESHLSVTSL
jgi:hypothetical protein